MKRKYYNSVLLPSLIIIASVMQTEVVVGEELEHQETSNASPVADNVESGVDNSSKRCKPASLTEWRRELDLSSGCQSVLSAPPSCHAKTFLETVYGNFCTMRDSIPLSDDDDEESNREITSVTRQIVCVEKTVPSHYISASVQILNSSQLLSHLGSRANSSVFGQCTVVLFYAPWCVFCVRLSPHYNALARAFPTLDVIAIDAYQFSSLNSRFGTIAVPNIMVFHNAKAVARFNGTERTLTSIAAFVTNVTGVAPQSSVAVEEQDFTGPLSSELSHEPDYLLALSWLFIIACAVVAGLRSATGRRVWNLLTNHAHLHID